MLIKMGQQEGILHPPSDKSILSSFLSLSLKNLFLPYKELRPGIIYRNISFTSFFLLFYEI
jgi:hypothetical protein